MTAATPIPPPPTNPHRRRRTAPLTLHPIVQTADGIDEESKRGGSRNVCAVKVGAENVPSGASLKILPHARTADEREEPRGLVDENVRCGAFDPTAARQDAAVHVGNVSNPAGHGDSGVTKNVGAIGDETGALFKRGREG
ncbi:putative dynein heavy chain [Trypanosoma cruzi]|nr:putative dynein heavy chain [Trypanosoma cruzi]